MAGLWDDVRFAVRRLRQQPGLTTVAILTLTFGLGANITIFTLIHAVMLRPLPVAQPAALYRLGNTNDCCVNSGLQREYSLFSYALFDHLRQQLTEFKDLAAFQATTGPVAMRPPTGGPAISDQAQYVSGSYFRMLGVTPFAGRLLEPADDLSGAAPAMVMSFRMFLEKFGGDRSVVGRQFVINGVSITLAGVTPPEFFGETIRPNPAGVWLPLGQEPRLRGATASLLSRADRNWLYAIGRLDGHPDIHTIEQHATHALQTWLAGQPFFSASDRTELGDAHIIVTSAAAGVQLMRSNFGQSLTLLFVMSGLVLLIAAANLANLLLARADRAQAAVRAALGASVGRLVRQALAEGAVLSLMGCAGAFLLSMFATRAIIALAFPPTAMLPVDLTPSLPILLFGVILSVATAAIFAAVPAWASSRANPIDALRGLAREGADIAFMPRRSLVVVQVTLSVVLLAGAGLLSTSLRRLEQQPLGFEVERRLVVRIDPPALAGEPERLAQVYAAMQERLERIPGVESATYSLYSPMEGNNWSSGIAIAGRPANDNNTDSSSWNRVGPKYFETMGTRVLLGRSITASDTPTAEHVVVVNRAFADKFLAGQNPIGARVGIGGSAHANDFRIVGIVENVKYTGASQPVRPMMFLPVMQLADYGRDDGDRQMQAPQARSTLVRTVELKLALGLTNLEPTLRRTLAEVHPDLTVTRIVPMPVQVSGNFRTSRLLAVLATTYGGLALLLAALGLYGVTLYNVNRRLHEIGVRMALGADRRRIVGGVLRSAVVQTAVGLVIGVPLAMAGGTAIASQLFETNARNQVVLGVAALVLVATAVLAAVVPARRAASVDPARALRVQ